MKAFGRLLTLLIPLLLVHARAQNNPKPSSLALPPCAVRDGPSHLVFHDGASANQEQLRCMQTSFTKATCDPTDQACICTSEQFDEEVTLCVTSSCTVRESLSMYPWMLVPRDKRTRRANIQRASSNKEDIRHKLRPPHPR